MLRIPRYIEALDVHGVKIEFRATPADIDLVFDVEVPLVERAADKASERSKLAFAAATTEWIAWRLDGAVDVADLLQFVEAMWAATVDYRYAQELPHPEPSGGNAGKIIEYHAWQKLNALFRGCPKGRGKPAYCANLTVLARHVLPKAKHSALQKWVKFAIDERLMKLWQLAGQTRDPLLRQGPLVPREAFDPDADFDAGKTKDYIRALLATLDCRANPYLRAPADMTQLGFDATPYTV